MYIYQYLPFLSSFATICIMCFFIFCFLFFLNPERNLWEVKSYYLQILTDELERWQWKSTPHPSKLLYYWSIIITRDISNHSWGRRSYPSAEMSLPTALYVCMCPSIKKILLLSLYISNFNHMHLSIYLSIYLSIFFPVTHLFKFWSLMSDTLFSIKRESYVYKLILKMSDMCWTPKKALIYKESSRQVQVSW